MADSKKKTTTGSGASAPEAGGSPPGSTEVGGGGYALDTMLAEGRRLPVSTHPDEPVRVEGTAPDGAVRVTGGDGGEGVPVTPTGPVSVDLRRSSSDPTPDQPLWVAIRLGARAVDFEPYQQFIDHVLCGDGDVSPPVYVPPRVEARREHANLLSGVDAYQVLRTTTEAFLLARACGVGIDPEAYEAVREEEAARLGRDVPFTGKGGIENRLAQYLGASNILPYLDRITSGLDALPDGIPFCREDVSREDIPCLIELIWSYWHEEGMLVQAINAVSLRFQNKRGPGGREPLANLEIHPLRPLSNLLWGYIQDEDHRLTVARRAYEYEHQYGLSLVGKAVPKLRAADRRSKFLEAFHTLLHQAALFYDRDADTTVVADGFALLNGLREVHMQLAEGAHNQFRDLPWTARVEMLVQQWLLARPEIRGFLGGRASVPYAAPWMGPIDSLKRLLGWSDTPVTHFHDLAVNGEQILLSIRYGDWSEVNNQDAAKNWARYWKPEIQRYVHAYLAATGVDLAATSGDRQVGHGVNATPPAVLLQRRLARQRA